MEVAAVEDHRTLRLADGRRLALAGVDSFSALTGNGDAPDSRLTARLDALIAGKKLGLRQALAKPDRYGRTVAYVFVGDRLVQDLVAASGLALFLPRPGEDGPCLTLIQTSEAAARAGKVGYWHGNQTVIFSADRAVLIAQIGRYALVSGKIVSVGTRRNRTYLNFGFRWSEDFTVEIDGRDRDRFGGAEALEAYFEQSVLVRGYLRSKSGPMIQLTRPEQIAVTRDRDSYR